MAIIPLAISFFPAGPLVNTSLIAPLSYYSTKFWISKYVVVGSDEDGMMSLTFTMIVKTSWVSVEGGIK